LTQFGSICIAVGTDPIPLSEDEDCLFVNIFAPSVVPTGKKLPVYFFIQGGGFSSMSSPKLNGNGLVMASGMNIVVVTLNYRVGPYGFLASQEVEQQASLNNGLKDIIQALKWLQVHIDKVCCLLVFEDPFHADKLLVRW
jgi:carboxylesterase type B